VPSIDASPARWVILAAGLLMCAYAWKTRQPHTSSDFTILYNSAAAAPADMYRRPPGPPRANMNPPHFQLLVRPLTRLPLPLAAAVWRTLGFTALCGCMWWLARTGDESWGAADVGALLAWSPMQSMINLNQVTWILWPLLVCAWWCWRRGRWTAGAVAFGFALSFKPFLGIFLIWFALTRHWRALIVTVLTATGALAIGYFAYGHEVFAAWLAAIAGVEWSHAVMNASLRGVLARSLNASGSAGTPILNAPGAITPAFLAGAALILAVTFRRTHRRPIDDSWPALMAASLLASPLGWLYYIWWMLPGVKPSRLLLQSPLLWIPMVCVLWGQPSPLATISIGSVFYWGLFVAWVHFVGNGIRRVGPEHACQVMQCDADAPAVG
jgi:Glycosyltransferase family 87